MCGSGMSGWSGTSGRCRVSGIGSRAACTDFSATPRMNCRAAGEVAMIGRVTAAAAIAAAAPVYEPMTAPPVAISPARPWAHAQEDAVVKVSRPVKAIRRAGVGRVVVIAVRTYRLNANADANDDLRLGRRRHSHARQQSRGAE